MPNKASGMPKYYIKPRNHQEQFPNEIWHFESVCMSLRSPASQKIDKLTDKGAISKIDRQHENPF